MTISPLLDLHTSAGASTTEAYGWTLPGVYSSTSQEYLAATETAGLADRSYLGRLEIAGADGLDLLNRLSTNKLDDLQVGEGAITALTSNKGRIVDLLHVLRLEDRLMVLTGPQNRQKVAEWIDFYTFVEDISVEDITESTAMVSVIGPRAESIVLQACEGEVVMPGSLGTAGGTVGVRVDGVDATLVRSDLGRLAEYAIVVPLAGAQTLWQAMLRQGAVPVGMDVLEAIRVERGMPAAGKELTEDYNPLEAGLLDYVSFNKGCYIGQEVVTRLDTYDKVQKHLVGLAFEGDSVPAEGASLFAGGKRTGAITSLATSPTSGRPIGLGYVRKAEAASGTRLNVASDTGDVAVVADLRERAEVS